VRVLLYTSAFCEPCYRTRGVLQEVAQLLPAVQVVERDIVSCNAEAELDGIRSTPTTVVLDADGGEVFRAEGVPTVNQVLVALARAV
jgi:thiol-disulfide isomerase/thioredoxin